MWSKKPKPGGKGLRCEIEVQRGGEMVRCDRPAKRYTLLKNPVAHWIVPIQSQPTTVCCCIAHYRKLSESGHLERVQYIRLRQYRVGEREGVQ